MFFIEKKFSRRTLGLLTILSCDVILIAIIAVNV